MWTSHIIIFLLGLSQKISFETTSLLMRKKENDLTWQSFVSRKKKKDLEQNLNNEETKLQYNSFKDALNDIYEEISNVIKIRSRCNWYELGDQTSISWTHKKVAPVKIFCVIFAPRFKK